jgi:hypothetical protein
MGLIITPTDYDDWTWLAISTPPSTSPASMADMNSTGIYCWEFTNGKALMFPGLQLPHGYKEGTNLIPHIHWAPSTSATYTGTWTLDYVDWLSVTTGTALGAKQTVTVAFNSSMTAFQVQSADFSATMTGTNRKISSLAAAKLSLSLSAGSSCFLVGLDAHFQKDRLGSTAATTK